MSQAAASTPLSPLKYRDYRLLWVGGILANVGNWMEIVLRSWLVLQLSNSPLMLGLAGFAHWLPFLLLAGFGGVYADRLDKRWILGITYAILALVNVAIGILLLLGVIQVWHVLVLVLIHGIAESFNNPARQSIVSDLVPRQDVMNAVSLNSATFYGSKMVGPAIGGILIAVVSLSTTYFIGAALFLAYVVVLPFLKKPAIRTEARAVSPWQNMLEGVNYVRDTRWAWTLIVMVAALGLFANSYQILLPVFARDIFKVGPQGLGFLTAASGVGAIVGSVGLTFLSGFQRKGLLICAAAALFGASLLIFAGAPWFYLAMVAMVGVGIGNVAFSSAANAVLQTGSPDVIRGRVMGVFTMSSLGINVFGSLIIGVLGSLLGAPGAVAIAGLVSLIIALVSYWKVTEMRELR